jgi:hypothetical protein
MARGLSQSYSLLQDYCLPDVHPGRTGGPPPSNCERYFSLVEYVRRATEEMIGIALGLPSLLAIVDSQYYPDLPGGVLESAGRLFKNAVTVYVYPYRDPHSGQVVGVETLALESSVRHLYALLRETHRLVPIRRYREAYLDIRTTDVLARLQADDPSWEALVPPPVVEAIKRRRLFGYASRVAAGTPGGAEGAREGDPGGRRSR